MIDAEAFFDLAREHFKWLVADFRFHEDSHESLIRESRLILSVIRWVSNRRFVEAVLEAPRPYLDIAFGPLVHGAPPAADDIFNRFHLSQLAAVLGDREVAARLGDIGGLNRRKIDRGLHEGSLYLRRHADDVLRGGDAKFDEIRAYAHWVIE